MVGREEGGCGAKRNTHCHTAQQGEPTILTIQKYTSQLFIGIPMKHLRRKTKLNFVP